jgi:hypothetical protein
MNDQYLFENLTLKDLENFVTDKQEENLHLDFKLVKDVSFNSTDDKRNFACALSGFSNSSGGLIIWGVDARKNSEGIDCALELKPISQVLALLTRLNALTGEAVDPRIGGVQHRAIETNEGRGFIVSFIPESDTGPHMAKLGENRYYKRSGESFYRMEHYDIADMFGKRKKPKLSIFYKVIDKGQSACIILGLRNEGRATAKAPFFAFESGGPLQRSIFGIDGNGYEGLTWLRQPFQGLKWAYGGEMDVGIHPSMDLEVAALRRAIINSKVITEDIVVNYAISCEDQPLFRGTLTVPLLEV